jgi:hypothetical protein
MRKDGPWCIEGEYKPSLIQGEGQALMNKKETGPSLIQEDVS